jgi:hypothetical protein
MPEIKNNTPGFEELLDQMGLKGCDCPPGECQAQDGDDIEADTDSDFAEAMDAVFGTMGSIAEDIAAEQERRVRIAAVAQLGRITEKLTQVAEIHAELLAELLED